MKVAFVYPIPFGEGGVFGGGERYVTELAATMSTLVETVLVMAGPTRKTEHRHGLRIETHPWITLVRGRRQNPLLLGFLGSLLGSDVVHCLTYHTLLTDISVLVGRLAGKRVFITDVGGGADITLARWLNIAALSHALLLLSEFAGQSFPGVRPPRRVLYGGVDVGRFAPAAQPREPKVAYVGRILPHKGINYLIDAVDTATPLIIAGRVYHQPYFDHLRRLAAGKNVTFITHATDADVIGLYRTSAAVVLPSVYRDCYGTINRVPELLGLSLLEAMSCGTPVICTDVGGMPEIVQDGQDGFVVPPNDSGALRDRIDRLINDPARVRDMGIQARASVLERFTWSRVADRCLETYRHVA